MSDKRSLTGAAALNAAPTEAMQKARWVKGNGTLNPGGRAKGLERRVRERVSEDEIIDVLVEIMHGRLPPGITGEATVRIKDRLEAARLLSDRGWGRAPQQIDVTRNTVSSATTVDVSELDADDVDALQAYADDAIRKMRAAVEAARARPIDVVATPTVED